MPSRLIREGILTSDRVNKLSVEGEVFYRRLLSKVDDYGLFDARPAILLAALYPLKLLKTTENDCVQWLSECQDAGLVKVYEVEGKVYLQAVDTKWKVRSEAKFPLPNGVQKEVNCKQLLTPVDLDVVRSRLVDVVVKPNTSSLRSDVSPLQPVLEEQTPKDTTSVTSTTPRGSRFKMVKLPSAWAAFCRDERPDLEPGAVFESFRDYWVARAGEKGVKLDWQATWRNWVRKEKRGGIGQTPGEVMANWAEAEIDRL